MILYIHQVGCCLRGSAVYATLTSIMLIHSESESPTDVRVRVSTFSPWMANELNVDPV